MNHFFKKMLGILVVMAASSFLFAESKTMYVGQKNAVLKETASTFGKTVTKLKIGQEVVVLSEKGNWIKIELSDTKKKGWVKKSALTKKKVAGITTITADAETISLAGKGSENHIATPSSDDDEEDSETIKVQDKHDYGNEK